MARRPDTAELTRAAARLLGHESLRSGQAEAVAATLDGRDVLTVMPTGHGKSAIYQLPAAIEGGLTVVVSPLIALQRDQVKAITALPGVPRARAVNSTHGARSTAETWRRVEEGQGLVLFLTPEALANEEVLERLAAARVRRLVVDEAHCIASWGHDFRPEYLGLGSAVERIGRPPVLALTATAPPPVREEIVHRLGLRDPLVVVRGFDRPNLHLEVHRHVEDRDRRAAVVQLVSSLPMPGLLYVATRRDTALFAEALAEEGLRTAAYHGGMPSAERTEAHQRFSAGTADVVVATSAFGMGIDKSDIRFVVHASTPDTLESYYQQIGRAGRDGEPARAVLFHRPEDFGMHRFHASTSPDEEGVRAVWRALDRAGAAPTLTELRGAVGLGPRRTTSVVNLLESVGAVRVRRSRVSVREVPLREVLSRAAEEVEVRHRVAVSRMEMMRGYADTTGCRRQLLLGYLGEQVEEPCGNCDTCEAGTASEQAEREAAAGADPFPVGSDVEHREWGSGSVVDTEPDRLTVLFESHGYRTLSLDAVQEEDLLTLQEAAPGRDGRSGGARRAP